MSDTESDEQHSGRLTGEDTVNLWKISSIRGRSIFEVVLLISYLLKVEGKRHAHTVEGRGKREEVGVFNFEFVKQKPRNARNVNYLT